MRPLATTIANISTGAVRYKLVSVVGHLVRRADEPSRAIFVLQDNSSLLLAELPPSVFRGTARTAEEGSTIRISGISMVNVEGPWNFGLATVQSTLFVRSLDDIQVISPPTWWTTMHVVYIAFVLALLTLASLVFLAFSRVEQSKLQGVLEERERLALEIHDTVIQGCVGVSSLLEAALGIDSSDDPLQDQLLNYASEQARTTIESAREAVWELRSASAPTPDVTMICEQLSRQFRMSSGVPVTCTVTGLPFTLSESATRELMMAVKEALANAATHAKPKSIHIDVHFTNRDLQISICDDGCGFDQSTDLSNNGHYGILGMQKRVRLLRGSFNIESELHQGTKVHIIVPRRWRMLERMWLRNANERVGTN
ncbi:MAG TPA: sensor histidine kinase [Terracidiphilus sp.]|nr:sensor histidine kinase [Terracidiphilus sp.]